MTSMIRYFTAAYESLTTDESGVMPDITADCPNGDVVRVVPASVYDTVVALLTEAMEADPGAYTLGQDWHDRARVAATAGEK